jgi:hypothetical protein
VATGGKCGDGKTDEIKPKPLPWVATGCRDRKMVKEGVNGSSPSEGFRKKAAYRKSLLSVMTLACRRRTHFSSAERVTGSLRM